MPFLHSPTEWEDQPEKSSRPSGYRRRLQSKRNGPSPTIALIFRLVLLALFLFGGTKLIGQRDRLAANAGAACQNNMVSAATWMEVRYVAEQRYPQQLPAGQPSTREQSPKSRYSEHYRADIFTCPQEHVPYQLKVKSKSFTLVCPAHNLIYDSAGYSNFPEVARKIPSASTIRSNIATGKLCKTKADEIAQVISCLIATITRGERQMLLAQKQPNLQELWKLAWSRNLTGSPQLPVCSQASSHNQSYHIVRNGSQWLVTCGCPHATLPNYDSLMLYGKVELSPEAKPQERTGGMHL